MVKKWLSLAFLMVIALILPAGLYGQEPGLANAPAQPAAANALLAEQGLPTDQIIIKFKDPVLAADSLAANPDQMMARLSQAAGVRLSYYRPMSGEANVLKLPEPLPLAEVEATSAALSALPEVAYAEPDRILQIDGQPELVKLAAGVTPNDPLFGDQWHYGYTAGTSEGLNLLPAWDITTGSASTVVAVIDTGILNHADLAGRTVPGYDFISDPFMGNDGNGRDSDPSDPGDWVTADECGYAHTARNSSWHGTHVAGTIGAATNNGVGGAGVNWTAKILPVRVLGKCGGSTSDIVDAMRWSAGLAVSGVPNNANPAQVLNLSLGGTGSCSFSEQDAIDDVVNAGTTIIIAAGNSNQDAAGFSPGNCDNIITVAANDRTGDKAYYSNFGSTVEVAAPGGETNVSTANGVLSTLNTGTQGPVADTYKYYQGTSMATPHVAGVASLIMGLRPDYTPAQVLARLQSTARPFPGGSSCNTSICGSGIVDAYQALLGLINLTNHIYLPQVLLGEQGPAEVAFSNANYQVVEAAGQAVIEVRLSRPEASTVTVNYATGGGSATAGIDYVAKAGILQFNPNQTGKTFNVTIIDNPLYEATKTIGLSLSNPGGAEFGSPANATLSITNDDAPPSSIINGNFEQGATGWSQFSTHGWPVIIEDLEDNSFPGNVAPRSGTWAVWLGGANDDLSYIGQQIIVPAGAPYLTYYHWIASEDACGFDVAEVIINDTDVANEYDLCANQTTVGWVKHTVNLSDWVNQSVSVKIAVVTDSSLNSNLFVDDVFFAVSADVPAGPPVQQPGGGQEALQSRLDLLAPTGEITPPAAERPPFSGRARGIEK